MHYPVCKDPCTAEVSNRDRLWNEGITQRFCLCILCVLNLGMWEMCRCSSLDPYPGVQCWWGREAQGLSQPGGFTGRILLEFGAQWVGIMTNTCPTYVALEFWGLPEVNLFKIIWHHMVVTLTLLILLLVLVLKGRCQKIISIKKKNPSANLLLRSNQSNTSMEHQREIRNARSKTKTKKFRIYIGD